MDVIQIMHQRIKENNNPEVILNLGILTKVRLLFNIFLRMGMKEKGG